MWSPKGITKRSTFDGSVHRVILQHAENKCRIPSINNTCCATNKTVQKKVHFFPSIKCPFIEIKYMTWTMKLWRQHRPNRDSIVGIATRYFKTCPDSPWGPPSHLKWVPGILPAKKMLGRGADHPQLSSTEVMNDYNYTSTILLCRMAECVENFKFYVGLKFNQNLSNFSIMIVT